MTANAPLLSLRDLRVDIGERNVLKSVALDVPALTWAVFEAVGPFPQTLQTVWGRIYAEWFPSSGYSLVPGPELLWNESKDVESPAFRSEIWIPVMKNR